MNIKLNDVIQNRTSDQMHNFRQSDKIVKLFTIIPYKVMQEIYKNDIDLRPLVQCELVNELEPDWIDRVLKSDPSVFDVIHDFVNIVKQEPFFVPRL